MTDNEIITIDEAIRHCYEVYLERKDMCKECREEHKQLAKWLEELKESREIINRQKTEIEMLEARLEGVQDANAILRERNEIAIAKVIRRYKEKVEQTLKSKGFWLVIIKNVLNDIEKEMVGDTE